VAKSSLRTPKRSAFDPPRAKNAGPAREPAFAPPEPPESWQAPIQRERAGPTRAVKPRAVSPRAEVVQEQQVLTILKSLVTKSPEARRLIKEVHSQLEELRRIDTLRKL
jgi:hypothetical protein